MVEYQPTSKHAYIHVVHLGVADKEDLSRLLLQALFPERDLSEQERERVTGTGWMAAFVVSEDGCVQSDSYLPASFALGVALLRQGQELSGINASLARSREEFAQRQHKMAVPPSTRDNCPTSSTNPETSAPLRRMTWDDLMQELQCVQATLCDPAVAAKLDWRVVVRVSRVNREYLDTSLQKATDYLNSFYLDDLDRLIAQAQRGSAFGGALAAYLGAPVPPPRRVDILQNHDAMSALLSAATLPKARWPSSAKHPLVMAQQAAVAHILDSLGRETGVQGALSAIGVNGPPGTGKTTLLCDVIAAIITQRAQRLAELAEPKQIFADSCQIAGKNFFPLQPSIMVGSSIVVASSNNNAVKNITQELPSRQKIAAEFGPAAYFSEVIEQVFASQKVLDEQGKPIACWAMVAAALGNTGNRRAFAKGFFRDDYLASAEKNEASAKKTDTLPPSIKQILEQASEQYPHYQSQWHSAKVEFKRLLAEFETKRQILLVAEQATLGRDALSRQIATSEVALKQVVAEIHSTNAALAAHTEASQVQSLLAESAQATLAQLKQANLPSLWDRLLAWFGKESPRLAALRVQMAAPTEGFAQASQALADLAKKSLLLRTQLAAQQKSQETHLAAQKKWQQQARQYEQQIQLALELDVQHFADANFWRMSVAEQQRASVGISPQLDTLRAKIFLQAMELHQLTILANAGRFISNLRAVTAMLEGANQDKLLPENRPMLWDALFFVVPVVSTTLAAFDRLFVGMGQNSLGWLLIDEAGQATPQSAAGAIWRSQRAVLIGDPLQIEPVFTVPYAVVEQLRQRQNVAAHWSPAEHSVQTLADRITRYGSWVNQGGESGQAIWTGMPLRTHRRCDEPMFSVANRIAYANQMVQGRVNAQGQALATEFSCALGESAWFDVRTQMGEHPVNLAELDVLLECLRQLQPSAPTQAGTPSQRASKIYLISPFRKVKAACQSSIEKAGIKGVECGTVHTFQGKEAEIVFLVLGTAAGPAGAGARAWAASKPNLLNVAITRAKCRLYVIGNAQEWGRLAYFSQLHEALPKRICA